MAGVLRSWPPKHARLALFFAFATCFGAAIGLALAWPAIRRDDSARAWIPVVATAIATGGLGLAGVYFHRIRVLHEKFKETESYLAAIELESAKYRALLEGAADMVLVLDATTGAILESNARARSALGNAATLAERMSDADARLLNEALARSGTKTEPTESLPEVRVRDASGAMLDCEARLAAVELADRNVVHVALRDRTREREMEHELAVRERLSSLGLLTAGVAHEIINPLEGIGNHVKLLSRPDLSPEDRARHIDMVRHGFERIRDLVRDLLRFARPASARGQIDLADAIERARRLAAFSESFRAIEVVTSGLDKPFFVLGDAGRLEQVVFNLLLNAANAMKGRGRIFVSARRGTSGARDLELVIADEGPGIAPEHMDHIFDPFFTTGGGTGLGLSIAFGILQAHGGTLSARNRGEGGAEFTLRLPDPAGLRAKEAV